ncbi:hypothetical protein FRC12_011376 [Ceratobasidium sp. 428]|nr:hypothetical protein FRC12_011376 [Ceratobasidium sp. 428]
MARCNKIPYSRGGFGDVYQGALLDGTKVALKCLRLYVRDNEANDKALKYAARELHTWSVCWHSNIVELLGLAEFRGQIAMVSPWMDNESIDCLNNEDNTINRYQLCFAIAQGPAYLHEINISSNSESILGSILDQFSCTSRLILKLIDHIENCTGIGTRIELESG